MKRYVRWFCASVLVLGMSAAWTGCDSGDEDVQQTRARDAKALERQVADYYQTLQRAYHGSGANIDSLNSSLFAKDSYYVTYWGQSEPIDSTTKRMRAALPGMRDYENRVEIMSLKVGGDMAFVFFVLRQTYSLNGRPMDEYLPTTFVFERLTDGWRVVHAHRSADFQTIEQLMKYAAK